MYQSLELATVAVQQPLKCASVVAQQIVHLKIDHWFEPPFLNQKNVLKAGPSRRLISICDWDVET